MSIGFTSKTFQSLLIEEGLSYDELFKWARRCGFDFVEIRDFDGRMKSADLQRLGDAAIQHGLHPLLAWDGDDVLSPGGAQNWIRHVSVAGLLPKPRYCRVTISPRRARNGGYLESVFRPLEQNLLGLADTAEVHEVTLVLENSFEQLWPSGEQNVIGFSEAIDRLKPYGICLDPTNLIVNAGESRGGVQAELERFIAQYKSRMKYVHLKSSLEGVLQDELIPRDDAGIGGLVKSFEAKTPVCVELPDQPDFITGETRARKAKSLIQDFRKGESFD